MTTYRIWPATSGPAITSYSGPFVGATQFAVSGGGKWLNGYYIWIPTAGDTSPSGGYNTALWSLITGASSGSGVLVPGSVVTGVTGLTANAWNFIALSAPIQLAPGWDSNSTGNGSSYVAAIGWTASAGFPDTNNYWGTGAGASGLTNGPLIAYSSNSGTTNKAPYGMAQGLFSSSTNNAASTLPNQVSGTDNFWVDVQVSDTAPAGYTGSYRLWPNKYDANDFTTGDAAVNYTIATEISLAQACNLSYIWYYSPTSLNGSTAATTLATRCDVWNISTGLSVASITSPSWLTPSGGAASAGTGWVKAAFAGGTNLPAGDYRVSVYNSGGTGDANWSAKDASTDYWGQTLTGPVGASGITSGPVTAPDYAGSQGGFVFSNGATGPPPNAGSVSAHAQSVFYQPSTAGGAVGFPQLYAPVGGSSNQAQNYWVDLEVTIPPPAVVSSLWLPPRPFPPLSRIFGPAAPFTSLPGSSTPVVTSVAANVTGVAAAVTVAGGAGTPAGGAAVTGVAAPVTVQGGTGTPAGGAGVTGLAAPVTVQGGTGTVAGGANVTGIAAPVTVQGGVGAASGSGGVNVTGVAAPVTVQGGTGTPAGGAGVTGVAAHTTVQGGTGTPAGAAGVTGVAAHTTVQGGTGTLSAAAAVTGAAALITVPGGTGVAAGGGTRLAGTVTIADYATATVTVTDQLAETCIIADAATGTVQIGDRLP